LDPPIKQPITDLTAFALDLCVSFDRPKSPDRQATLEPPDNDDDDDDSDDDWISTRRVGPKPILRPPAPFDTYGLQILYFDMYGTLIVRFQSRLKKYTNHHNRTTNREYSTLYGHFWSGIFITWINAKLSHFILKAKWWSSSAVLLPPIWKFSAKPTQTW
jgi:hypothetical protein